MNVGDFFRNLSYGELSNLSMANSGDGTIRAEDQSRVIHYTNQALTRLYVRFAHNRSYVKLLLEAATTKYRLHPQHAVSNTDVGNNAPRYLSDSASDPFSENLIKILSVVDISAENPIDLLLNDTADPTAVRTVAYDTLMVKNPMDGQTMEVEYVAAHPALRIPVDVTEVINLVPALHEALELYVAAKVYGAMNGEENRVRALSLMSQYEAVCRLVEEEDILQLTVSDTNTRFTAKGFV